MQRVGDTRRADTRRTMADIHVIEDNSDHADLIVWALRSLRHPIRLYCNGESFLRQILDRPGCIILDLTLPGLGSFGVISSLRGRRIELPIVCLAARSDSASAVRAIKAGAITVLERPVEVVTLRQAVTMAIAKDAMSRQRKVDRDAILSKIAGLEEIQRDLLRSLLDGLTNAQAAQRLNISLRTAERHRASVLKVLEVRTLNEAVILLTRAGIEL